VTLYRMGMSRLREESRNFRDPMASIVSGSVTSLKKKTWLTIGSHPSVKWKRGKRLLLGLVGLGHCDAGPAHPVAGAEKNSGRRSAGPPGQSGKKVSCFFFFLLFLFLF
jgi:hypothetical protein